MGLTTKGEAEARESLGKKKCGTTELHDDDVVNRIDGDSMSDEERGEWIDGWMILLFSSFCAFLSIGSGQKCMQKWNW